METEVNLCFGEVSGESVESEKKVGLFFFCEESKEVLSL